MKITVEELIHLVREEGYTDAEIAEKYNMHPDSIRKKRAKYGIEKADKRKRLERAWPEIRPLNAQGYNDAEIARMIGGITQSGVQKIRKRLGIPKADYGNRMDKVYVCKFCGKEVWIKRKERKQRYCEECKKIRLKNK